MQVLCVHLWIDTEEHTHEGNAFMIVEENLSDVFRQVSQLQRLLLQTAFAIPGQLLETLEIFTEVQDWSKGVYQAETRGTPHVDSPACFARWKKIDRVFKISEKGGGSNGKRG